MSWLRKRFIRRRPAKQDDVSMKMERTNVEWVAQVSLLRPGFLSQIGTGRNTQVSKARPGPPTQSLEFVAYPGNICLLILLALVSLSLSAQTQPAATIPNGRQITPVGDWITVAPFPFALAMRPRWAATDSAIAGISLCPECNRSSRYRGSQGNADSSRVPQRSWSRILCGCSLLSRREGAVRGHRRHRRSGRDVHRRLEKDCADQPQRRIAKPSLQGELCGSARAFKGWPQFVRGRPGELPGGGDRYLDPDQDGKPQNGYQSDRPVPEPR